MAMGIFFITLYISWITVEIIAKEYKMQERTRVKWLAIVSLASALIAISCSGDKEEETFDDLQKRMNEKYSHVMTHNDSVAALFREMEDTSVDLDSVLNSPYVPDSSKIIAIKYPDDYFETFEEAFAKARQDLGANKGFIWMGKFYSTNYKEEGYPPWTYQSKSSMDQQ